MKSVGLISTILIFAKAAFDTLFLGRSCEDQIEKDNP